MSGRRNDAAVINSDARATANDSAARRLARRAVRLDSSASRRARSESCSKRPRCSSRSQNEGSSASVLGSCGGDTLCDAVIGMSSGSWSEVAIPVSLMAVDAVLVLATIANVANGFDRVAQALIVLAAVVVAAVSAFVLSERMAHGR